MNVEQVIAELHEQVMRDRWTLEHCPDPAPSVDFYADRIIDYEDDIRRLREEQACHVSTKMTISKNRSSK